MDKNQRVFFELIKAGLWEGVNENLNNNQASWEGVDWSEVYRLAEEQSVIGLVAAGIERIQEDKGIKAPQEWALQFIGTTLQIEQQNKAMNEFVAKLIEKLRNEGVYALLLKGQGVASCYEKPLWRSSGDVDLFLSEENYSKAKKILTPLASSIEKEYQYEKHLGMTIDGWVVELHGNIRSGLSTKIDAELDDIQNDTFCGGMVRSWMNGETQVFLEEATNDALYVFSHILNHFYKEGVGLRQICDWCRLLWTYRDSLDLRVLELRLKKMWLMSEWRAFGAYAMEYLGMPIEAIPLLNEKHYEKLKIKTKRINDFILSVGNMGYKRDVNYMKKSYITRKYYSALRRLNDIINHSRIFPVDSLRFSVSIVANGVKSAMRGE